MASVAMVLGDLAVHRSATLVRQLLANRPLEESLAALAADGPVVATRRPVAANQTQLDAHIHRGRRGARRRSSVCRLVGVRNQIFHFDSVRIRCARVIGSGYGCHGGGNGRFIVHRDV